jgi:hypothetical protein
MAGHPFCWKDRKVLEMFCGRFLVVRLLGLG